MTARTPTRARVKPCLALLVLPALAILPGCQTAGKHQEKHIPQYGVITEVAVKTKGINNTVTAYPQFRIIRWRDGEAAYDTLSSLVTDGHSGTGNFDTTIVETTITPTSSPTVIDKVYNYGLLILHPYYTGLSTAVRIYNVKVTGTIATMRMD